MAAHSAAMQGKDARSLRLPKNSLHQDTHAGTCVGSKSHAVKSVKCSAEIPQGMGHSTKQHAVSSEKHGGVTPRYTARLWCAVAVRS